MTMQSSNQQHSNLTRMVAIGFALGGMLGFIVGWLLDDIALWNSVGIGLGMAVGAIIGGFNKRRKQL